MLASIILDVILIATVIYSGYWGYKRGFVRSIAKIARIFVAFSLAYLIAPYFSKIFVEPILYDSVSNRLNVYLLENFRDISDTVSYEELPTLLKALAAAFNVNLDFTSGAAIIDIIVERLSIPLVRIISLPLAFVAVYFLIKFLIRFVVRITDEIFKIKLLGIPNKMLGCVLSTFLGVIFVWGITVTFNFFISLPAFSDWAIEFDGGFVYEFFNKFTPIEMLLSF